MVQKEPIALVGIATEFPSGEYTQDNLGHDEFRDFLMEKKDSYVDIPKDRMDIDAWHGRGLGRILARKGSFLKNIGMFDPTEFGITAKDARAMAVSTRKLVELSFLALVDSGIDYRGHNVGCFATATAFDMQSIAEPDEYEPKGSLAGIPCMIANKISYHLDLRGPSIPIDTACSSTAVAMHLAISAIRNGECEAAVVAGCQLNLRASDFSLYSQASILSPDGKCKPFDAGGNGFGRAEGAAVVVLKPLNQALKDGDHIYATVLGTGVSSCGSLAPVNAPVAEAQADAMYRAYQGTGRHPSEVDFVEVHGTGTAAGDPTEANWVGSRFARPDASELLIGSVKGNVGHMEITSFLASLSKVCSILHTKQIPPQVNLRTLNSAIHWDELNLRVPLEPETIKARAPSGKLLISICSSGIGGVNGHAVIESPPEDATADRLDNIDAPVLLIAAGLSPRSAATVGDDLRDILSNDVGQTIDYSIIYGRRARQMTWRSFSIKKPGADSTPFSAPILCPKVKPPLVFLFSGQGPQHLNMGRQLFETYPVFRNSILDMDSVYKLRTGRSLVHDISLFGPDTGATLPSVWPISLILPSLTAVQLALFDLLLSFGARPDALIGHSAGETCLLYASGAGSKEMALEISIARGIAMSIVEEHSNGTMAAIACSAEDARRIIQSVTARNPDGVLDIACYNGPDAVALAGHTLLVDDACALAEKSGFMARKIMTRVPVHSSLMELCREQFLSLVEDVFVRYPGDHRPKLKTYSTCTGELMDAFTPEYFWKSSRNSVQFTTTMARLLAENINPVFMEISPHPVLSAYVQQIGVAASSILGPMRRSKAYGPYQEHVALLTAIGQLVVAGYNQIDYNKLNSRSGRAPRAVLPSYPFVKKYIEYFPEVSRVMYKQMNPRNGPLNFPDLRVNTATHPELGDHVINGEPIMPAAGFIEMGLEFGARTLWNINFHSILPLSSTSPLLVEVALDRMHYTVKSSAPGAGFFGHSPNHMRLHADGFLSKEPSPCPEALDITQIQNRCTAGDVAEFYATIEYFAQYGPVFSRVDQIFIGKREALSRIKGVDTILRKDGKYVIHPAILDAAFHACVHPAVTKSTDPNVYFLPARVNAVMLHEYIDSTSLNVDHVYAHVTFQSWLPHELVYDVVLAYATGVPICTLQGFVVAKHFQTPPQAAPVRYTILYQSFGITSRPKTKALMSSRSSDSGYTSDAGTDCLPVVNDRCRDIAHHIVKVCGKVGLRLLELHAGAPEFLGKRLVQTLEDGGAVLPTYTVASTDIDRLQSDSLPERHSIIEWDPSNLDKTANSPSFPLDLIVGIHSLKGSSQTAREVLTRLRSLLTPGGFLVLALDKIDFLPLLWGDILSDSGFENIVISSVADDDKDVIVEAQSPALPTVLSSSDFGSCSKGLTIIPYALGNEMDVQASLRSIDDAHAEPIWIVSSEGTDADGLTGFSRTISKEFPQWNVRWASFGTSFSDIQRRFIIERCLPQSGLDVEFVVDNALQFWVPRIMPLAAPSGAIRRSQETLSLTEDEIRVAVTSAASSDMGLWGVVGTVTEIHQSLDSSLVGKTIVSVSTIAPTQMERIHIGTVAVLPSQLSVDRAASLLPSLFLGGLALGVSALSNPKRLKSRIIVTHAGAGTGQDLTGLYEALGLSVANLGSALSPTVLHAVDIQSDDLVLTGADETDQLLKSYLPNGTRILYWKAPHTTRNVLCRDPWIVSEILTALLNNQVLAPFFKSNISHMGCALIPSTSSTLFSPERTYMLIGGIGSLGPYIALWMYQRGARHIVLTSRSGRKTMERMGDSLPAHVFYHLEKLPGLCLYVEAADSSDPLAMRDLIGRMAKPLAGCILMAATFDDRLFFSQDHESFLRSFSSKVGTLDALDKVVDVAQLDFIISLSSGTIWGNAGQTNYTSANTTLDGRLQRYKNAFSIASPAIFDTTSMSNVLSGMPTANRASHLSTWACSPQELCSYLEDGLLKLEDEPFGVYIPPVDFNVLQESLGSSHLYDHLVRKTSVGPQTMDADDLHTTLQSMVLQFVDVAADEFSDEVPLTAYGLDSLSAGRLSFALKPWIIISQMQLLGDLSLRDLEGRIQKIQAASAGGESSEGPSADDGGSRPADIDRMIEQFSIGLNADTARFTGSFIPESVVFLTGSTGGLGSYFLAQLLQDESVIRVYAYNRPSATSSTLERQASAFSERHLDIRLLSSPKLVFLEGDATQTLLGLEQAIYEKIKETVTVVIHNAWRLDLNAPLKTFIPNISATRNLIDFALSSTNAHSIRFAFISSVASTQNWDIQSGGDVPEDIVMDANTSILRGYGEGKYVAERIVARSGLQAINFRVGQLCGSASSGAWSTSEWVPMLVKSSISLGALPDAGGVVSWVGMDKVAPIVLDVILSTSSTFPTHFNVVHPNPTTWHALMSTLGDNLSSPDQPLTLIPFTEWISALERAGSTVAADADKLPALKLLDRLRIFADGCSTAVTDHGATKEAGGWPRFTLTRLLEVSPTLRGLAQEKLGDDHVHAWIEYWREAGFLQRA